MTQVVEQFGNRSGVPHPHEHNCSTLKAVPVCFLKCDCGYEGLAHVNPDTGKPICPADLARKQQATNEDVSRTNQVVQQSGGTDVLAAMIAQAVKEALAAAKGGN